MTRGGVKEYIEAVKERYLKAGRKEKRQTLDEANKVTGYHRFPVIRLPGGPRESGMVDGRGRSRQ